MDLWNELCLSGQPAAPPLRKPAVLRDKANNIGHYTETF